MMIARAILYVKFYLSYEVLANFHTRYIFTFAAPPTPRRAAPSLSSSRYYTRLGDGHLWRSEMVLMTLAPRKMRRATHAAGAYIYLRESLYTRLLPTRLLILSRGFMAPPLPPSGA